MDKQDKPKENFICIFRTPYQSQVSIIESLLNNNKITYYIENYNFASFGSADGSINFGIMVHQDSAMVAKALLKDFISPPPSEESDSVKSEMQRKFRENHPIWSVLSGLLGSTVGSIFIVLGILIIKIPVSFKGIEEIIVKAIFVLLLCIMGYFIFSAGYKEIKITLKLIKDKKRHPPQSKGTI